MAGSATAARGCIWSATPSCATSVTPRSKKILTNFKAALEGVEVAGAFINANTPGTIEHWLGNEFYPTEESMLYAIAECMRVEYNAIVAAGFDLHVDNPDLPDAWNYPR